MIEWTAMRQARTGEWQPVGTSGSRDHVAGEYADWARDCPDLVEQGRLTIAYRHVGGWQIDELAPTPDPPATEEKP